MCVYVEEHKNEICANVLPGVHDVLSHLQGCGALLGVATGNLEGIGRLKLQNGGLLSRFRFAGFSDALESRMDVFCRALGKARSMLHAEAAICIIGDTPADIKAAHKNGVEAIAVASGVYSVEDLSAARPELCIASLQQLLA
jgi:phosphoglycolate phosphatase-like HAD superfamily hydrolase